MRSSERRGTRVKVEIDGTTFKVDMEQDELGVVMSSLAWYMGDLLKRVSAARDKGKLIHAGRLEKRREEVTKAYNGLCKSFAG